MIGIFSKTIDSNFVEAAGYSGLDFIILDQEHGPVSNYKLHNHVRSASLSGMQSIVRVPDLNEHSISAALDSGADGVQIPHVSSYQDAIKAVKSARFYPLGKRGVCRFVRAASFGEMEKKEYFKNANDKTIILQVEGVEGVDSLDQILTIKEIDVLFIGPYDLSQSVGLPGEINHPKVNDLIEEISNKVKKTDKILGTFVDTYSTAKKMKDKGFEYLAYSVDVNLFAQKCREIKREIS